CGTDTNAVNMLGFHRLMDDLFYLGDDSFIDVISRFDGVMAVHFLFCIKKSCFDCCAADIDSKNRFLFYGSPPTFLHDACVCVEAVLSVPHHHFPVHVQSLHVLQFPVFYPIRPYVWLPLQKSMM